jgi:hypothetical protein
MAQPFNTRRPSPSASSMSALDFGLRVRIDVHPAQRSIFCGPEALPVQALASALAESVAELRVRSFALRSELEEVTSALQRGVDSGVWPLARRAALDLSGSLDVARRRRLADAELCWRAGKAADRVAELCAAEGR